MKRNFFCKESESKNQISEKTKKCQNTFLTGDVVGKGNFFFFENLKFFGFGHKAKRRGKSLSGFKIARITSSKGFSMKYRNLFRLFMLVYLTGDKIY